MVPVSRRALLIDWVRECGLPVLLVAGNRLGAINHTLLSLGALETRKMRVLGVIFNDLPRESFNAKYGPRFATPRQEGGAEKSQRSSSSRNPRSAKGVLRDNPKVVRALSGQSVLGVLPWMERPEALQKRFTRVGEKVLAAYRRFELE